jgi:hypothetical protein
MRWRMIAPQFPRLWLAGQSSSDMTLGASRRAMWHDGWRFARSRAAPAYERRRAHLGAAGGIDTAAANCGSSCILRRRRGNLKGDGAHTSRRSRVDGARRVGAACGPLTSTRRGRGRRTRARDLERRVAALAARAEHLRAPASRARAGDTGPCRRRTWSSTTPHACWRCGSQTTAGRSVRLEAACRQRAGAGCAIAA